jgi:Tol biopolymer transport system component/beta-lactamase regulating signal transducer with metallopeptidase domain
MSDAITVSNWINDAIFVSLVNTALQMTVLIALIALFIWIFRIKSATTRYSLWLFALFAVVALPLLTPFIPRIDFTGFHHHRGAGYGLDDMMRPGIEAGDAGDSSEASGSMPSTSAAKAALNREIDVSLINPVSVIYFIWCAGALSMLCVTICVYVKLRKLRLRSHDIESQAALAILSRLRDKLVIRRTVALKASSEVYIPMSVGIFSPVIIVPDSVIDGGLSHELEMILAHELAHIRRCDYLIRLLQNVLGVVFFFHPLFHLMKRNLAREREHICDDWVIDLTRRRSEYAECLVGLLERAIYGPVNIPVTLAMAERKRDIPGRVDMIVDRTRKTATKVSRKALITMLIIGCLSLPVMGGIGLTRFAPAQVPQQAQIAFHSNRDGNNEIYVMDADGKNQRNITNNPAGDWGAAWSPGGQRIAFGSNRDGILEVYVMDADGKNQRNITNNLTVNQVPVWSPDGQSIAFESFRDGNSEIYAMDADGKNQRNLTNNPAEDWGAAWSPDGQSIAFASDRDGNGEIYAMDADGKNPRNLTNSAKWDGVPAWSPDGQRIAFQSWRDAGAGVWNCEVYVMDADGKNQRNLTNNPADDGYLAWSPDGQRIAFASDRDGNSEIYVMDADGKNQRNLTNNPADDGFPDWFDPAFAYSVSPAGNLRTTWGKIKVLLRSR